ncbi:MAG: hypothetical protein ABIG39_04235 [Candidatus Micrarchaeota archaeon]
MDVTEAVAYNALNKAWKSTTRIIFGEGLGELRDYEDWLKEYVDSLRVESSAVSKSNVHLAIKDYCKGAKFMSFEEVEFGKKFDPLNINEIKDIESIAEAIQERCHYTGNVVLGNSRFVQGSSNIVDSNYVYNSIIVSDSKYVAYCDTLKMQAYSFGLYGDAESSHIIKCVEGHKNRRNFECHVTYLSSDCYYSANLQNCKECMFSFGLQARAYNMGNLQLTRDKYCGIKAKILSEVVEKLKKEKRVFSLLEIIRDSGRFPAETTVGTGREIGGGNKEAIENAFTKTSHIVLGKELHGIDEHRRLLEKHVPNAKVLSAKSPITGRRVLVAGYFERFVRSFDLLKRVVSEEEAREVGKKHMGKHGIEALSADPEVLPGILHEIAYIAFDASAGNNRNMLDCAIITNSEDCYNGSAYVYSKKCGYSFWPRHSEHVFGSGALWNSAFCINAHYSKNLTRTFEVDSCDSCSDLYFSHNCENVNESMFCFNTKNLKNAIGNVSLNLDKYSGIKERLLEQIVDEISRTGNLEWDIYNIGCMRDGS